MSRQYKLLLLILDFLAFLGIVFFVGFLRSEITPDMILSTTGIWVISLSVLTLYYVFGAYDINHSSTTTRIALRTLLALILALVTIVIVNYLWGRERSGIFGRGILFGSLAVFGFVSVSYRILISQYVKKIFANTRVLFVSTYEVFQNFVEGLSTNSFRGQFSFILDRIEAPHPHVIGTWQKDLNSVLEQKWQSIVVALGENSPDDVVESLMLARFESNRVKDLVQFYEENWQKIPLYYIGSRWFMLSSGFQLLGNPIRQRLKRLMDVFLSLVLLILASPLMLLFFFLIPLESPGSAIYRQTRTGRDGKLFTILKFRSMRQDAEKNGAQWAEKNDTRITKLGYFIRKTRIDELPQLFNILEGSMSFVGPRPERPEFNENLEKQIPYYNLRHIVQPGLTGWAQVLYPYGSSIEDAKEKLQYDLYYIKKYSMLLDLTIVLKTIQVVLLGRGR